MGGIDGFGAFLIAATVLMALPRMFRHKGNIYKALAHVYVGWIFGYAYASGLTLAWYLAWVLTGVEVVAFVIGLARKRRDSP